MPVRMEVWRGWKLSDHMMRAYKETWMYIWLYVESSQRDSWKELRCAGKWMPNTEGEDAGNTGITITEM